MKYLCIVLVFGLKGRDNVARGNAPGSTSECLGSLKGCDTPSEDVSALQAGKSMTLVPGALPQATLSQPFGLKNARDVNDTQDLHGSHSSALNRA